MLKLTSALLILSTLIACNSNNQTESTNVMNTNPELTKIWESDTTLQTPESVIYDPENNVIYVSCIGNLPPGEKDNDGYIAQIDTNGKILNAKWASGLSAPKGMGIYDGKLYVTDIDYVAEIDLNSGEIMQKIDIPGATFLNDLDIDKTGKIYITDSDNQNAFTIENGVVSELYKSDDLLRINGVLVDGESLIFSSSKSGNVIEYNLTNGNAKILADSIFAGDGVKKHLDGYLISSWNGEVYYIDNAGMKACILDTKDQNKNAADIEFITSKKMLLIPTFNANSVAAYRVN